MDEIIGAVIESLGTEDIEGDEALPFNDMKPVPISKDNFNDIGEAVKGDIAFIDGGNAEILGAASFSLQLIKTAVIGRKKVVDEFYLLVTFKDNEFQIQTFPKGKLPNIKFDSLDPRIRVGNERALANRIAGICRRLAELKAANECNSKHIVLDGDLYARTQQEEDLLGLLKGKKVYGLTKTSSLLTKHGRVFAAALSSLQEGAWLYSPVFKGGDVKVSFVKLHPASKHVFMLSSYLDARDVLGMLKGNSTDPVFPGYPYGLVQADKAARVSKKEVEYQRTKLMAKFGSDWKDVKTYLRTKDAHDILDSVG
ncbi:hypothetical protein ACFL1B_01735 [Nanoarchaeota archaeon]